MSHKQFSSGEEIWYITKVCSTRFQHHDCYICWGAIGRTVGYCEMDIGSILISKLFGLKSVINYCEKCLYNNNKRRFNRNYHRCLHCPQHLDAFTTRTIFMSITITIIILLVKPTGSGTWNHSWLKMFLGNAQQSGWIRTGYTLHLIVAVTRLHSSQMCVVIVPPLSHTLLLGAGEVRRLKGHGDARIK